MYVDGLSMDSVKPQFRASCLKGGDSMPLKGESGRVWGIALRGSDDSRCGARTDSATWWPCDCSALEPSDLSCLSSFCSLSMSVSAKIPIRCRFAFALYDIAPSHPLAHSNPIFVSVGHRVSLDTALQLTKTCGRLALIRGPFPRVWALSLARSFFLDSSSSRSWSDPNLLARSLSPWRSPSVPSVSSPP